MEFLALKNLTWVLPLAILALAVAYWAHRQRKRTIALLTQGAEKCNLQSNASPLRRRILGLAILLSLLLALVTALRPTGGTQISEMRRPAKNIIVLLDTSLSMNAVDIGGVSRINAAKLLLREFINSRPTDRIGLISFAGGTFPEGPITLDRTMLLQRINTIAPGDIPVGGTDLRAALEGAQKLLTDDPPPGSAIVILSDGDNVTGGDPMKVLMGLEKAGIPVLAVAFGQNGVPASLPGRDSDVTTTADYGTLRTLADATTGIFIAATPQEVDAQVAELGARIDTIEIDGTNVAAELYERPLDLYAYPLTLALILLMIHLFLPLRTKKWHPLTAALAVLLLLPQEARSEEFASYDEALAASVAEERPLMLVFIGSDWSKQSVVFEREILSHEVFKKWAASKVVSMVIDLPRIGISDEVRLERRQLASKFAVEAYPMVVFVDKDGNKMGSLTHDPNGPNSWTQRADAILSGDSTESDLAASVDYLAQEIQDNLNDATITAAQRSVRYYNKALELEKAEPELSIASKDRFKLLNELYYKASAEAPKDRPDLAFAAEHKLALLNHRKGLALLPKSEQELMLFSMKERLEPVKLLKRARGSMRKALGLYKEAAPLQSDDEEFSTNLALVYQDLKRVQAYLDFLEAYQSAIEKTSRALEQEKNFVRSLEREVTTRREVNKLAIDDSAASIQALVQAAEAIEDTPTILPEDGLKDYRLADEDIVLAPSPHRERDLKTAQKHLQDALDHLIDPQQMQPQSGEPQEGGEEPQDGEGEEAEGKDGEEEGNEGRRQEPQPDKPGGGGEEEEEKEGDKGDADADLRRADNEKGDLRDSLLQKWREQLRRNPKYIPRSQDH